MEQRMPKNMQLEPGSYTVSSGGVGRQAYRK
jgi:hypothetical protein